MHVVIRTWIVCVGVAFTGFAVAAPRVDPEQAFKRAQELDDKGDVEGALVVIDEALASAPKHLRLLSLKGDALLRLRDYAGALGAYQAYIAAGPTGANLREAQKIVASLSAVKSTHLELTVANGPATIYLDTKTLGVFCVAAPSCTKPALPGEYKVIAERDGFERWTGRITVAKDQTAKLPITLVEKPSELTVRVTPPDARITVDGNDYGAPIVVAPGIHPVVVARAGHVTARREATAREGKPVVLEVALTRLVPIRVEPAGATLTLGDSAVAIQDGGIVIPPGKQVLVVRAGGFHDRRVEIPEVRGEDYQIEVMLERVVPPPPPPSPFTFRRKVGLGVGAAGLAAAVGGIVLTFEARRFDRFSADACKPTPCSDNDRRKADELAEDADTRTTLAGVAYGVAGAAAITAVILWMTGAPESRVTVAPRVGPVAGLDLAVSF